MDAITFSIEIKEDRHLVIDLPPDTPLGRADLIITIRPQESKAPVNLARETARAKLLAAGFLVIGLQAPEGTVALSPEERLQLGTLPAGGLSVDDLINEDRGEF
jgi:hypothetical protein